MNKTGRQIHSQSESPNQRKDLDDIRLCITIRFEDCLQYHESFDHGAHRTGRSTLTISLASMRTWSTKGWTSLFGLRTASSTTKALTVGHTGRWGVCRTGSPGIWTSGNLYNMDKNALGGGRAKLLSDKSTLRFERFMLNLFLQNKLTTEVTDSCG